MEMKTHELHVTDTNWRSRGHLNVGIRFFNGSPAEILHSGARYFPTGKVGTHIVSGAATMEMATEKDARLWVTMDCTNIFED